MGHPSLAAAQTDFAGVFGGRCGARPVLVGAEQKANPDLRRRDVRNGVGGRVACHCYRRFGDGAWESVRMNPMPQTEDGHG
jgi:hypothetical protein